MRRRLWVGVTGAVGVLIIAGAVHGFAGTRKAGTGGDAGSADAVGDRIVRVTRRDIGMVVKATGVIRPSVGAEVNVGSRVSGVVKRLYVQIGDSVRRGQLLAELDDRDLGARRDEAVAAVRQAEVTLSYARRDRDRAASLFEAGAVSRSDLDVQERAVRMAEQQLAGARASLSYATTQLQYARISAPISGIVDSVSTQEGETVAASFAAPTFVTLLDPARLEVWAYVDETDIGRIRAGQAARFTVDTYGDEEFPGRITAVHPRAEIRDNVVNYVAVVKFPAPGDRVLRPEMTTTVRIPIDLKENRLALPIRALHWRGGRPYVLVPGNAGAGAEAQMRWVTTGARDESWVEVVAGLKDGDAVLVAGGNGRGGVSP